MGDSKCIKTSSEAEDRLSKLPESILCHILSFLPTEDAAKTSILSKMWRFLFHAVPKIDIDGSRTYGPENALVCFINRRLMLCRTTSITEFRLICEQLPRASVVHLWLTALVLRNVEVLDIQLLGSEDCKFGEHFLWHSLMVLKLHSQCGEITFKLPESVLFPNLKVLNFTHIKLECQSETYKFSDQAFPRLEELRLEQVTYGDSVDPCLYISLSTLKKLSIEAIDSEYVIKLLDIHSPQLQHLELLMSGGPDLGTQINMCNLESIVSVHFFLCQQGDQFTNILSKVNNAKELALLVWAAEGLEKCVPLPQFPNLTHLKIGTPAKQLLWNVLQNSPNLETLNMKAYQHPEDIQPDWTHVMFKMCCPHPENVPPCFGRTLREIYIGEFSQTEAEIEAVGFILQHGVVLHRLTLELIYGKWELSTFKRLLKLKRCSPHCEIELV